MAVNRHVVGWVGKDEIDLLILKECSVILFLAGIAAQEAVITKQPQIAAPRHCLLRRRWNGIGGRGRGLSGAFAFAVENEIGLGEGETGEGKVEFRIDQELQLSAQNILIPAGIQRQLVIGQNIGAPLALREMRQPDGWG